MSGVLKGACATCQNNKQPQNIGMINQSLLDTVLPED